MILAGLCLQNCWSVSEQDDPSLPGMPLCGGVNPHGKHRFKETEVKVWEVEIFIFGKIPAPIINRKWDVFSKQHHHERQPWKWEKLNNPAETNDLSSANTRWSAPLELCTHIYYIRVEKHIWHEWISSMPSYSNELDRIAGWLFWKKFHDWFQICMLQPHVVDAGSGITLGCFILHGRPQESMGCRNMLFLESGTAVPNLKGVGYLAEKGNCM